jgi:hypothetical protein
MHTFFYLFLNSSFAYRNPAYSKLVMFVQTEMRGKLTPSIIEKTMPSNLVSFILNAKDGIKAHKAPSAREHHKGHHSTKS